MNTEKEYVVIYPFRDLQDIDNKNPNGRIYAVGDSYANVKASQERLKELSTKVNRMGRPLIEVVEVDEVELTDLRELTVQELKDLAKDRELSGYSTMNKSELVDLLEGD